MQKNQRMIVSNVKLDQISSLNENHKHLCKCTLWIIVNEAGQYDTMTTRVTFKGFVGLKSLDAGQ